jgi:hypothetical protein
MVRRYIPGLYRRVIRISFSPYPFVLTAIVLGALDSWAWWGWVVVFAPLALWVAFDLYVTRLTRRFDDLADNLSDSPNTGEPSEAMVAVDEFEEAIRKARGIPFSDQVRVDRRKADVLLDHLRMTLNPASSDFVFLLDSLEELVRRARPIPLTEEIRLDREEIYDVLDRMRASTAMNA